MAQRGTPLSAQLLRRLAQLRQRLSVRQTARLLGISPMTVQKYAPRRLGQAADLQFGTGTS